MTERGLDDDAELNAQYGTTDRLETRAAVWQAAPGTVAARDAVVAAVSAVAPRDVLDVGCGTGTLTRGIADAVPGAAVLGVDRSAAMVAATRELGLAAQVATVTALPFEDASFDVVTCCWVLYHVPDIGRAVAELARVLRPEGRLVVVTNSATHLAQLFADAGVPAPRIAFTAEEAGQYLEPRFGSIEVTEHPARASFEDREAARRYLATLPGAGEDSLPAEGWPRQYAGSASVLVCSQPR